MALAAGLFPQATWGGWNRLTRADEEQVGRRFHSQVREYLRLSRDPDVQDYVEKIGGSLVRTVEPQPFFYRFVVIEDDDINAFAVPGGYIYLNTGLLSIIDTPDELAAVMAHEVAHVNRRHASQSLSKGSLLDIGMFAAMLGGMFLVPDNPKAAMGIMAGAAGANLQAKYAFSRQQEREADKEGLRMMRAAGYKPKGIQTLFEKMKQATRLNPTNLPPYLLTHPLEEDRIRAAATPPEDGPPAPESPPLPFEKFRTTIRVRYSPSSEVVQAAYREEAEKQPGDHSRYLLGIAQLAAGRPAQAAEQLKGLSEEFRALPDIERDLGRAYLDMGAPDQALPTLQTSTRLFPNDYLSWHYLARCYEAKGLTQEAIAAYQKAVDRNPYSSEANYQLGVLLGRDEKLGPAHYSLARYYLSIDEPEKAAEHYKKSIALFGEESPDGKRVQREMREILKE
ncbi:MAG: M48 family metalloprotease [Nitrospirae bacterium]|nr:M48 family metalloprotease [Nitrospirota bacterium]